MEKTEAVAAPRTATSAKTRAAKNPRTAKAKIEVRDAFGKVSPTTAPPKPGRPVKRADLRSNEVRGRNGEILTRNRASGDGYVNEFDIPESARDPNYDLHWARVNCYGKGDNANINELYDNGWRPASPKNYTRVMPDLRDKEIIERDGLMLMERPWQLSNEAFKEQYDVALELREIQSEAFGKRKLPKGFDKGRKARDGNFNASKMLNRTLEQSPREAKPQYAYASPGDED